MDSIDWKEGQLIQDNFKTLQTAIISMSKDLVWLRQEHDELKKEVERLKIHFDLSTRYEGEDDK